MKYSTQLEFVKKASGWSQEQLAQNLDVSFQTLNSWINERSRPRAKALLKIDRLYLSIVGVSDVDEDELRKTKQTALKLTAKPKTIATNKEVLDKLTLYLTYHTNTIEGSTMTLSDVEEVIFEHKVLSNRSAIEQAEARNHQSTLHWLLNELIKDGKSFVIDEALILGIHLRLMNGIISGAGQYREHTVRILGSHVTLANWAKIPKLIAELADDLKKHPDDCIETLASTHATFEQIHPFSDGNGRTGRLIMLIQALKMGLMPPLVVKERRYAYYKYLEIAQTEVEYKPLELFIAEAMLFTDNLLRNKGR